MGFLRDVLSNAMGCVFSILFFICLVLAILSLFVSIFGFGRWLEFGIFLGLAILFSAIAGALGRRRK